MSLDGKDDAVIAAVNASFQDRSRTQQGTRKALEGFRDHVISLINAIDVAEKEGSDPRPEAEPVDAGKTEGAADDKSAA